jgi:hypothetical protein
MPRPEQVESPCGNHRSSQRSTAAPVASGKRAVRPRATRGRVGIHAASAARQSALVSAAPHPRRLCSQEHTAIPHRHRHAAQLARAAAYAHLAINPRPRRLALTSRRPPCNHPAPEPSRPAPSPNPAPPHTQPPFLTPPNIKHHVLPTAPYPRLPTPLQLPV